MYTLLFLLGSQPFLSITMPIFGIFVPWIVPIFLKQSLVFPLLLFSSIFVHCSLKTSFLSLFTILWKPVLVGHIFPFLSFFPLLFFLQLFVKHPQITTLPSCFSFSLGCFCSLPPVQYFGPLSIVLQAYCLLGLIP